MSRVALNLLCPLMVKSDRTQKFAFTHSKQKHLNYGDTMVFPAVIARPPSVSTVFPDTTHVHTTAVHIEPQQLQ